MAASSRRTAQRPTELHIPNRWKDKDLSPERTMVWTEPPSKSSSASGRLTTNPVAAPVTPTTRLSSSDRKVPVVYYLCRNGQLEHPHFMEVPLSSPDGLFLSDVIDRLNLLRGRGMASMYSWSSKRSYKNGFVWHDLAENDFIYPSHGTEYVLKGSELLEPPVTSRPLESVSFRSPKPPEALKPSNEESDFPVVIRRRNQSWSSIDLGEYKVYKTETSSELNPKAAADAATQTDDKRRRRRPASKTREIEDEIHELQEKECGGPEQQNPPSQTTELNAGEISPPPSDSSPETLETLMKADKRLMLRPVKEEGEENSTSTMSTSVHSGRMKASSVLMQLLSCGSLSFKDCGATYIKDQGTSLVSLHKEKAAEIQGTPRSRGGRRKGQISGDASSLKGMKLEEKEYFSGSLIETKKEEIPCLKRSNSYNADR
ncbi:hypothetical protein MLD38_017337 [Melastoma candidum]|uniref:Uncharacterized protein n=1 Tax=Melastoma candidum TaxID=119954 RepID=A0ACB9QRM8_9MYRT|nr:hypothetical protein MLD38_017337 [Melastoma candidum]